MNKLQEHIVPECALCHNYISVQSVRHSGIQLVNCSNDTTWLPVSNQHSKHVNTRYVIHYLSMSVITIHTSFLPHRGLRIIQVLR